MVAGNLILDGFQVKVLFDPGATHSFISKKFIIMLNRPLVELNEPLYVMTPVGKTLVAIHMLEAYPCS